ncbi:hypothetical protein [Microvirga sp. M2]|uniref:hypothetical protein n=1 Tax=Microvirga sp. M2 TaxID=3073270 RepID=UPI0039C29988
MSLSFSISRSAVPEFDPAKVARILSKTFNADWSGKPRGRFILSHKQLCRLANRKRLHQARLEEILEECEGLGLCLVDLDGDWLVLSTKWVERSRRASNQILSISGSESNEDQDDTDEE